MSGKSAPFAKQRAPPFGVLPASHGISSAGIAPLNHVLYFSRSDSVAINTALRTPDDFIASSIAAAPCSDDGACRWTSMTCALSARGTASAIAARTLFIARSYESAHAELRVCTNLAHAVCV